MSLIRRREANTTRRAGVLRKSVAQLAVLGLMATGAFAAFAVPTAGAQVDNKYCQGDNVEGASGWVNICKDGPATAVAGNDITYTLTITENTWKHGFHVTDELPDGLTLVSATGDPWDCSKSTDTVVDCTFEGNPDDVDNTTITVVAHIDSAFIPTPDNNPVLNCAYLDAYYVHGDSADATGNQSSWDCAETDVSRASDLSIVKTLVSPTGSFTVPADVHYTITVTNNGPSDSDQIAITDAAPGHGTFDLTTLGNQGWDCSASIASNLNCTHDALVAGDSASLDVTLKLVDASQAGLTLNNCASVNAGDPSGASNSTSESPNQSCVAIEGTNILGVSVVNPPVTPAAAVAAAPHFTG